MKEINGSMTIAGLLTAIFLFIGTLSIVGQVYTGGKAETLQKPIILCNIDSAQCFLTIIDSTPYIHSKSKNLINNIKPDNIENISLHKIETIRTNKKYAILKKYVEKFKQKEFIIVTLKNR